MNLFPGRIRPNRSSPGVALVVTLMMMSVLMMMVVGLAGVMRNEQAAARNLTYQVLADQLADIGARAGMAAVQEASPLGASLPTATGPGWAFLNSERPLYSTDAVSAGRKNLEEIGTNSLILSLRDGARASLQAAWISVIPPAGNPNLPVGRFAWWVDDEGTKANLNAGAGTNTNLLGMISAFPLSLSAVFKNATLQPETAPWARRTNLVNRSNAFPTLESLKDTNVVVTDTNITNRRLIYRRNKGHLTVWSSNVDLNPWGQPKAALASLLNPTNITNDTEFATLVNRTFANSNVRTLFGRDFVDKYGNGDRAVGSNVIRQTLANAYESMRYLTNTTSPPLQGTNTLALAGTNVPAAYQGQHPGSLYINEIVIQPYYNNLNVNQCQVQIWVYLELVNLGPNNVTNDVIAIVGPTNTLNVNMTLANGTTFTRSPALTGFFKSNGTIAVNMGGGTTNVAPGGFFTNQAWVVFGGVFETPGTGTGPPVWQSPTPGDPAGTVIDMNITGFQLSHAVLCRKFGRRPVPVDWVQGPLPPVNFVGVTASTINIPFTAGGYSGSYTDFAPPITAPPVSATAQSFSRADPRARIFPSWTNAGYSPLAAWTNAPPTWGASNPLPASGGTLPGGLVADVPANPTFWFLTTNLVNTNTNAPAWTLRATNWNAAGYTSVSQLGKIHTGLPWRTLRMSSQTDSTGSADPDPPDWLLLDLFTAATNSTDPTLAAPRLNPNTRISHAGGTTNRLPMTGALLASLTNTDSWLAAADRWNTTDWSRATNSLQQTNISWVSGSTWPARRAAAGLAGNAFFFTGEMMEVDGIGNVGLTDAKREAAAAALSDLVSPRSDTFSVWSVGQGLAVDTNRSPFRTNILGEVRRQTVFQRIPQFNTAGALTGYQLKVLYTRNHVME